MERDTVTISGVVARVPPSLPSCVYKAAPCTAWWSPAQEEQRLSSGCPVQTVGSLGTLTMGEGCLSRGPGPVAPVGPGYRAGRGRDGRQAGKQPTPGQGPHHRPQLWLGCVGVKVRGCQHPEVNIPLGLPGCVPYDLVPWHLHCFPWCPTPADLPAKPYGLSSR